MALQKSHVSRSINGLWLQECEICVVSQRIGRSCIHGPLVQISVSAYSTGVDMGDDGSDVSEAGAWAGGLWLPCSSSSSH